MIPLFFGPEWLEPFHNFISTIGLIVAGVFGIGRLLVWLPKLKTDSLAANKHISEGLFFICLGLAICFLGIYIIPIAILFFLGYLLVKKVRS